MSEPTVLPGDWGPEDPPGPVVATDVNGDGRPDVLCTGHNGIDVMLNMGGALTKPRLLVEQDTTTESIKGLAAGDLNQDGIIDIVEGYAVNNEPDGFVVNTFLGLGDGGFSKAIPVARAPGDDSSVPAPLFLSDLNLDGYPDIVSYPDTGPLLVLLHLADGGYRTSSYSFTDPNTAAVFPIVTAALVPRAGAVPDLVVSYLGSGSNNGVMQLLLNEGDGTFSKGPSYTIDTLAPGGLAVSDFNGDCLPDVAVANDGCWEDGVPGDDLLVFFGLPDGGFGPPQSLPRAGAGRFLAPMGMVSNPQALAATMPCTANAAIELFGDASRH